MQIYVVMCVGGTNKFQNHPPLMLAAARSRRGEKINTFNLFYAIKWYDFFTLKNGKLLCMVFFLTKRISNSTVKVSR